MKPGNLVHRKSSIPVFGAIVGHAGIVVGPDRIIDCNLGRGRASVGELSFTEFVAGEEFWGERELAGVTDQQRNAVVARAREIASWATEYDDLHNNQKGEWFNEGSPDKYWESDCVGLAEHCYEFASLDIVVNEGIVLTVPEQRDAMTLVHAISAQGRANLFTAWLQGLLGERELWLFHQEFPSDRLEVTLHAKTNYESQTVLQADNTQIIDDNLKNGVITDEEAHLISEILKR